MDQAEPWLQASASGLNRYAPSVTAQAKAKEKPRRGGVARRRIAGLLLVLFL